jgi:hypothetical protein
VTTDDSTILALPDYRSAVRLCGIPDPAALQTALLRMGFESATEITPATLNSRYLSRRKDGLQVGGGFRMMQAKR